MKRGLERKLLIYFLLIVIAALMIGVEFAHEMSSSALNDEVWKNISASGGVLTYESANELSAALFSDLRTKVVVMFGVLIFVVAIVLVMFVRNITMPLQKMVDVAHHINDGDLSQIVVVETGGEIGQLGMAINELASNLQEVSAITRNSCERMLNTVEVIRSSYVQTKGVEDIDEEVYVDEIDLLVKELVTLKNFSGEFDFLETNLNGMGS